MGNLWMILSPLLRHVLSINKTGILQGHFVCPQLISEKHSTSITVEDRFSLWFTWTPFLCVNLLSIAIPQIYHGNFPSNVKREEI